jgi:hypothetical protein
MDLRDICMTTPPPAVVWWPRRYGLLAPPATATVRERSSRDSRAAMM